MLAWFSIALTQNEISYFITELCKTLSTMRRMSVLDDILVRGRHMFSVRGQRFEALWAIRALLWVLSSGVAGQ